MTAITRLCVSVMCEVCRFPRRCVWGVNNVFHSVASSGYLPQVGVLQRRRWGANRCYPLACQEHGSESSGKSAFVCVCERTVFSMDTSFVIFCFSRYVLYMCVFLNPSVMSLWQVLMATATHRLPLPLLSDSQHCLHPPNLTLNLPIIPPVYLSIFSHCLSLSLSPSKQPCTIFSKWSSDIWNLLAWAMRRNA